MIFKQIYNEDAFFDLMNDLYEEYGSEIYNDDRIKKELIELKNKEMELFCLFDDENNSLGYVTLHFYDNEKEKYYILVAVIVKKEYRGKGIGKIMMNELYKVACAKNVSKIILGSRRGKEKFYISCGYNGEGLVEVNGSLIRKKEIEEIFKKRNVKINEYVFDNNNHKFYFNAEDILNNEEFVNEIEKNDNKINLTMVFSKDVLVK